MKNLPRIALSGFLFSLFGFICLCGNVIFVPLICLHLHKFKAVQNFARILVYHSWGLFLKSARICGYLEYKFIGIKREFSPGTLIIANHPSLLDVVFFLSYIKGLNCVIKSDLKKNIFLAPAIISCAYISNEDEALMLEKCKEILHEGQSLLIFPEGTRTKESINFHKVASYLAINSAKNLECIFISVYPRALQKGRKWFDAPKQRVNYTLAHKESILIDEFCKDKSNPIRVRNLHSNLGEKYNQFTKEIL